LFGFGFSRWDHEKEWHQLSSGQQILIGIYSYYIILNNIEYSTGNVRNLCSSQERFGRSQERREEGFRRSAVSR
jgi:hypothetical protein